MIVSNVALKAHFIPRYSALTRNVAMPHVIIIIINNVA